MENGDKIQYQYPESDGDQWTDAVFAGETRFCWLILDDDGGIRDYLKDRVEVRRALPYRNEAEKEQYDLFWD